MPGTVLADRYRLVALLGRGGMGEVYRADDLRLGQTVALKFLPEDVARDPDSRARFYAEIRLGRQVAHPNVCRLYDLVEFDGHQCLSMAFVEGEDLASLLRRLGRLPPEKALDVARDVCAGLAAAHEQGVIHRDLKPGNVMIDGRGRALITDFGIAALVDRVEGEPFAGTPAYMAPELFDGAAATPQSDLYAFALLLVEAFSGQRLHDGRTPLELKQQRLAANVPLTQLAPEVPREWVPLLQECLDADPARRPASARALLARLPGGDALQRVLAAGETPTPAMVAAAARVGDLTLPQAWAALLAALLGLAAILALVPHSTLLGRAIPEKPPEVLAHAARGLLEDLGVPAAIDSASGFFIDTASLVRLPRRSSADWSLLEAEHPGPLQFLYRTSPRPLLARQVSGDLTAPAEIGRVQRHDPPLDLPGMAEVVLDRRGRLLSFTRVPSRLIDTEAAGEPDWSRLLAATGLGADEWVEVPPARTAPVASDVRRAWQGKPPDHGSQPPIRIEAASLGGQPVWFELQGREQAEPAAFRNPPFVLLAAVAVVAFGVVMYTVVIALVARNLRQGRGDTRGALRLALTVFLASFVALLLRADHVPVFLEEAAFLINMAAQAFYFAAVVWASYLAMEPFVRRTWPQLLIGWSRLLAGRRRDPLVGRDLLLGALCGIGLILLAHAEVAAALAWGWAERSPLMLAITPYNGARHLLFLYGNTLYFCVEMALCALFFRYLASRLWRWQWLTWLTMAAFFFFPVLYFLFRLSVLGGSIPLAATAFCVGWLLVLWRLGLLAAVVCLWVAYVLQASPLSLEFDRWYVHLSLLGPGLLLVLLLYGFHSALAGKPWMGQRLFEPERNG